MWKISVLTFGMLLFLIATVQAESAGNKVSIDKISAGDVLASTESNGSGSKDSGFTGSGSAGDVSIVSESTNSSSADNPPDSTQSSELQVIKEFTSDEVVKSEIITIEDQEKRLIMFIMGVPLLIFIFITAGLGVAMGVYGKNVFVAHMVFAGLSLTLALAHAIVGVVWFFPF